MAFYPQLGKMRRTLFAGLEQVKEAVRAEMTMAYRGQALGLNFAEVPYESLPFAEWRADADHGPSA